MTSRSKRAPAFGDDLGRLVLGGAGLALIVVPLARDPEGWASVGGVAYVLIGAALLVLAAFFRRVRGPLRLRDFGVHIDEPEDLAEEEAPTRQAQPPPRAAA